NDVRVWRPRRIPEPHAEQIPRQPPARDDVHVVPAIVPREVARAAPLARRNGVRVRDPAAESPAIVLELSQQHIGAVRITVDDEKLVAATARILLRVCLEEVVIALVEAFDARKARLAEPPFDA